MGTGFKAALSAVPLICLSACSGENLDCDFPQPGGGDPSISAGLPAGAINSAQPTFQWPHVESAKQYLLEVRDNGGNGYSATVDAGCAGCASGTCSSSVEPAYHNADLSWSVRAEDASHTAFSGSFRAPNSLQLYPETSDPERCESWPAVAYGDFIILNNIWNARSMSSDAWQQTIQVDQTGNQLVASWAYDWLEESDGGTFDVKAYPEVIYGNKLGTHVSAPQAVTGLPAKISDLQQYDVTFKFSETGDAERNVALESFFHDSCAVTGPCDLIDNRAYEMMIWVGNPTLRKPGSTRAESDVLIDGRLWDVWTKPVQNQHYIAFTAKDDFSEGTLDWNAFVNWTVDWTSNPDNNTGLNPLLPEHCMGAIELGTELWWGQGTFRLEEYSISVN